SSIMTDSHFASAYTRIRTTHAKIKSTKNDIHSIINSCLSINSLTVYLSMRVTLYKAINDLQLTIGAYTDAVNKLRRRVDNMISDTTERAETKQKEETLFSQMRDEDDEGLDYDEVSLKDSFLPLIESLVDKTLSKSLAHIHDMTELNAKKETIQQSLTQPTGNSQSSNASDHSINHNHDQHTQSTRFETNLAPLPTISLIPFNGESTDWESFYSQYTRIIDSRTHLSKVEKLVYLRNALRGPALKTVEGIPIGGEYLDDTITRLKENYGRSKRSNTTLINQLHSIKPKSHSLEDQLECTQQFINKVIQISDKSVVDNFIAIHQIAGTIHSTHIKRMYTLEPSTMMEALKSIESDIREQIEIRNLESTFRSINHNENHSHQRQKEKFTDSTFTKPSFTNPPKSSNGISCVYCGKHKYSYCPTITSISDRKSILREKKLCFKLYTASVSLQNPMTNRTATRHVFLDTGGMVSVISRSLVEELSLKPHGTQSMTISGIGGEFTGGNVHDVVTVNVVTTKGLHSIQALVMDSVITRSMHLQPLSAEDYTVVKAHCGDVPHFTQSSIVTPDLLISITDTQDLLVDSKITNLPSGYRLTQSILGPMITGKSKLMVHSTPVESILTSLITDAPFEKRVEQFFSLDETAREYGTTETEARLEINHKVDQHFHETVQVIDNQYQVQYYLKPQVTDLPTNFELAYSRLKSNVQSLSKNIDHIEFYNSIINDQLTSGMIEEVESSIPIDHQSHYLAHQSVLRPDKPTTPLRIVYDASAKMKGKPCLDDVIAQENSHLITQLINNVYVDNVIINTDNPSHEMYSVSKSLFQQMHMNLRDYASNNKTFIQSIDESERAPLGDQKLLGIVWNPDSDDLSIRIPSLTRHTSETKRIMLSTTASIYDPMGLLQPLTLPAKSLVQQLWSEDLKWDQSVDQGIQTQFHELLTDIESFNLTIPRFTGMSTVNEIHLVAFADASKLAMGTAIYLWTPEKTTLLMSRTRLAPAKSKATIPKLELNALVMAHTLLKFVVDTIRKEFPNNSIHTHTFSDSAITLFWCLQDSNKKNNGIFVANRVKSIHEMASTLSSIHKVTYHNPKYVQTHSNPADHITRGLTSIDMNDPNHMWWQGAPWMKDPPGKWPDDPIPPTAHPPYAQIAEPIQSPLINLKRCSTLNKAVNITGFVLRFIQRSLTKSSNSSLKEKYTQFPIMNTRLLTALERSRALQTLIRNHQSCHIHTHDVWIKNNIISQDETEIWRANSRLDHADIPAETKSPILIPTNKDSTLARLIISHTHVTMFHAGTENVLNQLKNHYWIPRSRQLVKSEVRSCIPCRKTNNLPYAYTSTPPLPTDRVTISRPFQSTGIDFIGPFNAHDNAKMYAVIFTCLSSRLSHIEVTDSLLPSAFINAFRRFTSRRGTPTAVLSDQATTLKLSKSDDKEYLPPGEENMSRTAAICQLTRTINLVNSFWSKWHTQYLITLRDSKKDPDSLHVYRSSQIIPKQGAIVLIIDESGNTPRSSWHMGKIISVSGSEATLKSHSGRTIQRPINLLIPLELESNFESSHNSNIDLADRPTPHAMTTRSKSVTPR
ncbi:hypothetical protein PMAYCL1PPCAC_21007, partial [Pristionchus mayeri]